MEKINMPLVANALQKKGASQVCPICGKPELKGLREEEFQLPSFNHPKNGTIDASNLTLLPCAAVVCLNCGYVAQFSLRELLK